MVRPTLTRRPSASRRSQQGRRCCRPTSSYGYRWKSGRRGILAAHGVGAEPGLAGPTVIVIAARRPSFDAINARREALERSQREAQGEKPRVDQGRGRANSLRFLTPARPAHIRLSIRGCAAAFAESSMHAADPHRARDPMPAGLLWCPGLTDLRSMACVRRCSPARVGLSRR